VTEEIEFITDNHMHIDPVNGLGAEAAKRFKRAGGTCIFLVNKMSRDYGVIINNASDFKSVFSKACALGDRIADETGLKVFNVIGVHPAEFLDLIERFGEMKALQISCEAVEIAGRMVSECKAVAIGEMGRPHFKTTPEVFQLSNKFLLHAMEVTKDVDCALQLHTEGEHPELLSELSNMAEKAGLSPNKLVKHFSGPPNQSEKKYGVNLSVLASKENVLTSIKSGLDFLLESDYIDDNHRPGAVLGPKSVPRITKYCIGTGILSVEMAEKIHKDNIERVYGVDLE